MSGQPEGTESATLQPEVARKINNKILTWGKSNYQHFPWREPGELWHGLIAEILLQRTKADTVVGVYNSFVNQFPSPSSLANASIEEIESIIFPLGLRWRAPFLKKLGRQLVELGGIIPDNYDALIKFSGVGDYVASAWLSFHGGKRSRIVDANVVRFICRITGMTMDGETRRKRWLLNLAEALTPVRNWKSYNYAILDFTMLICSKKPLCHKCPIGPKVCLYGNQQLRSGQKNES